MKHRKDRYEFLRYFPKGKNCAEIGVAKGDYASFMLERLEPKRLYLIDCWARQKGNLFSLDASNNTNHDLNLLMVKDRFRGEIDAKQVKVIKGFFSQILPTFPDGFLDWAYCDADQTYDGIKSLLDLLDDAVSEGGYICGDDYCHCPDLHFGTLSAIEDFCDQKNWNMVAITGEDIFKSYALKRNIRTDRESVFFVFGKTDDIESVKQVVSSLKTDLEWEGDICVALDRDSDLYRSYFEDRGIFYVGFSELSLKEMKAEVLAKAAEMQWKNIHFVSTDIIFTERMSEVPQMFYSNHIPESEFRTVKWNGEVRLFEGASEASDFFETLSEKEELGVIAEENVTAKLRSYLTEEIYRDIQRFNALFAEG